jgi:hypothetical protein
MNSLWITKNETWISTIVGANHSFMMNMFYQQPSILLEFGVGMLLSYGYHGFILNRVIIFTMVGADHS